MRSIAEDARFRDAALLERAWSLPVARTYGRRILAQSNRTTCGVASLSNALGSLGLDGSERALAALAPAHLLGFALVGASLDALAAATRRHGALRPTIVRGTPAELREHLARCNDPRFRYVINFDRSRLFGSGPGHHSPIAGYLEDEDLALVLDVNPRFGAWLCPAGRLLEAAYTRDLLTRRRRGFLRLETG